MENKSLENEAPGGEEPFEFKNLLSEMFSSSFSYQNPTTCISLEQPKTTTTRILNNKEDSIEHAVHSSSTSSSSSPNMISFAADGDEDYDHMKVMRESKKICRSPMQSQDHLLAERKRRERFTQLFAELAKTIPGLKKLDKTSILEDAINHIAQLQERVRALEEGTKKNMNIEESTTNMVADNSFHMMTNTDSDNEIKVQILDKNVFIGIQCSKISRKSSILSIIAGTMEKLHLTVHNIRVTPSIHTAPLNIAILAQLDDNSEIGVKDVENAFELVLLSAPNRRD